MYGKHFFYIEGLSSTSDTISSMIFTLMLQVTSIYKSIWIRGGKGDEWAVEVWFKSKYVLVIE